MDGLGINLGFDFAVLKVIIGSTLAAIAIAWWIWVVHCSFGQMRGHHMGFIDLIFECFRSLCVVLIVLTLIAFL